MSSDDDFDEFDHLLHRDDVSDALLWATAWSYLFEVGDTRPIAKLLREYPRLSPARLHELADLLDPPEWASTRLEFKKFRNRKVEREQNLLPVAYQVLKAEALGEKRYLAVPAVAKRIGKSERHVWEALEFYREFYQGRITRVTAITQSGSFVGDTTIVTVHSQTGSGAILLPLILEDGTVLEFAIEEPGIHYQIGDSVTFADAINGGKGAALLEVAGVPTPEQSPY